MNLKKQLEKALLRNAELEEKVRMLETEKKLHEKGLRMYKNSNTFFPTPSYFTATHHSLFFLNTKRC
jgi:hypothetical protein